MLETNFQQIMNIGFTAKMEDNLELVAENHKDWKTLIRDFWKQFIPTLETAEKEAFVPKDPDRYRLSNMWVKTTKNLV